MSRYDTIAATATALSTAELATALKANIGNTLTIYTRGMPAESALLVSVDPDGFTYDSKDAKGAWHLRRFDGLGHGGFVVVIGDKAVTVA